MWVVVKVIKETINEWFYKKYLAKKVAIFQNKMLKMSHNVTLCKRVVFLASYTFFICYTDVK